MHLNSIPRGVLRGRWERESDRTPVPRKRPVLPSLVERQTDGATYKQRMSPTLTSRQRAGDEKALLMGDTN